MSGSRAEFRANPSNVMTSALVASAAASGSREPVRLRLVMKVKADAGEQDEGRQGVTGHHLRGSCWACCCRAACRRYAPRSSPAEPGREPHRHRSPGRCCRRLLEPRLTAH